ncbi:uncharacterized protein AKAW2_60760S [Aspergillus luchuensis]|uniref:Uncharacterized protein n=1 Tax=Aspergillus kawachii TaxID=1069201 RepID=A0A7R7WGR0_ASPKA|nr:uncharacterized protein AKAW2_60760S [Aspergillus luchuensis]BCS02496.1 hypothetical protein AKAW2_60760S [Aspergillus luchuensis]
MVCIPRTLSIRHPWPAYFHKYALKIEQDTHVVDLYLIQLFLVAGSTDPGGLTVSKDHGSMPPVNQWTRNAFISFPQLASKFLCKCLAMCNSDLQDPFGLRQ